MTSGGSSIGREEPLTSGEDSRQSTTSGTAVPAAPGPKSTGLKSGDRGSTPRPLTTFLRRRIVWRQPGGLPECPYFYRWVLDFGWFSIRLHKWVANDDLRALHDHPHWFITLVLWGGYTDLSRTATDDSNGFYTTDSLGVGSIRFRPAHHRHMVRIHHNPTWTLLLTGLPGRRWGFYPLGARGKAMKRDKYFAEYGHHPCDPADAPVRVKPDGTRI